MYSPTKLNLSYQSPRTNSRLLSILFQVEERYKGQLICEDLIEKMKQDLDFLPAQIKKRLRFGPDPETFVAIAFYAEPDTTDLHERIFNEAKAINSKRRADYEAGKKFILDYYLLFEVYTQCRITSQLESHYAGMKFHPHYEIEQLWQN